MCGAASRPSVLKFVFSPAGSCHQRHQDEIDDAETIASSTAEVSRVIEVAASAVHVLGDLPEEVRRKEMESMALCTS